LDSVLSKSSSSSTDAANLDVTECTRLRFVSACPRCDSEFCCADAELVVERVVDVDNDKVDEGDWEVKVAVAVSASLYGDFDADMVAEVEATRTAHAVVAGTHARLDAEPSSEEAVVAVGGSALMTAGFDTADDDVEIGAVTDVAEFESCRTADGRLRRRLEDVQPIDAAARRALSRSCSVHGATVGITRAAVSTPAAESRARRSTLDNTNAA
jgi:hypothetical protein